MVFIRDEDSYFEAPLEKVWKLMDIHLEEPEKIHPGRNSYAKQISENVWTHSLEREVQSKWIRITFKHTLFRPFGRMTEITDGPLKGSIFLTYYRPEGNRTAVGVVGNIVSPFMNSEDQLKATAEGLFGRAFNEDSAYLATMK